MVDMFAIFLNSPRFLLAITHVVSIPSLILYAAEMIVIRRNTRHFSSSFYQLVYVQFITFFVIVTIAQNVLVHVSSYSWSRLENAGLFYELFAELPEFMLRFCFSFFFYAFHAQNFSTFLILLNRFTSVVLPTRHYLLWNRLLPATVIFVFAMPLPLIYQNLFEHRFYVVWHDETENFLISYRGPAASNIMSNSFLVALMTTIIGLNGIALNTATIIVYVRRVSQRQHSLANTNTRSEKKRERLEFRLMVYAVVTFISQLCNVLVMVVLYYTRQRGLEDATRLIINFFPLFGDLLTICLPACLMLWADRDLRRMVLALRIFSPTKSVTMPPTVDVGRTPTTLRLTNASRI